LAANERGRDDLEREGGGELVVVVAFFAGERPTR
jgi:hypothetical protein